MSLTTWLRNLSDVVKFTQKSTRQSSQLNIPRCHLVVNRWFLFCQGAKRCNCISDSVKSTDSVSIFERIFERCIVKLLLSPSIIEYVTLSPIQCFIFFLCLTFFIHFCYYSFSFQFLLIFFSLAKLSCNQKTLVGNYYNKICMDVCKTLREEMCLKQSEHRSMTVHYVLFGLG